MAHDESGQLPEGAKSPAYFKEALEDAERLLKYAAETGIEDVDPKSRSAVLHARAVFPHGWNEDVADNLLAALSQLAARVQPVSAVSLKFYYRTVDERYIMRGYLIWVIVLSAIIIPTTIATFVSSNMSAAIRDDINKANGLAVKLSTELGPPERTDVSLTEKIADLQDYASTVRLIYSRSRKLNHFVIPSVEIPLPLERPQGSAGEKMDPYQIALYLKGKFELPVPLPLDNLAKVRDDMTNTYQDVRYFAQTIRTDISTFYGAINSCILPILYALLGTCAYLLRTFEDQITKRAFVPSSANSARFLIAAIGGTVIGLFGNFTAQVSASPLAVAFLVGYSVEVFFAFLEGLIKAFTKSGPASHQTRAASEPRKP